MAKRFLIYNELGLLNGKYFVIDHCPINWKITEDENNILNEGPEHPLYKSTWKQIIETKRAEVDGTKYRLEEDKDLNLWLVGE